MNLGNAVQISIGGVKLDQSLSYYETLGFRVVNKGDRPFPWVQMSDGIALIMLNEDEVVYTGLTYFSMDLETRVAAFEKTGVKLALSENKQGFLTDVVIKAPGGLSISMVHTPIDNLHKPKGQAYGHCGDFHEVSVLVDDVQEAIDFYEKIGFETTFFNEDGHQWATLTDEMMELGIYSKEAISHYFKDPALTFFHTRMDHKIKYLKGQGITFVEEIPHKTGVTRDAITLSPEGQSFFLFYADF